jgi:hypothetical protein
MKVNPTEAAATVLTSVAGEILARHSIQMELMKDGLQAQARIAEMLMKSGVGENVDLHV